MIFGIALANITHKLDSLRQKDGESISSHVRLKEDGLACLKALIEEAPTLEYLKFCNAQDYGILLAYTLNLLCHYARNEKSRSNRTNALETMLSLMSRLESVHHMDKTRDCSIRPVVSAVPGVSSTLFQLIMSDTKLPRSLLVVAIRSLSKLISITFLPCKHRTPQQVSPEDEAQRFKDTCDNLAIRFSFLVDYTKSNSSELPQEMLNEILDLCCSIVCTSSFKLLSNSLRPLVSYLAFMSADNETVKRPELKLKLMVISENVRERVKNCDDGSEKLDSVIISDILKLIDDLETDSFLMLAKERESKLATLLGFLKLLPEESLTTFFELEDSRKQLIGLLIRLSEFSSNQPFLLLTDSKVAEDAIEISSSKIYTMEKRFKHLTGNEVNLVREMCHIIGLSLDWLSLNDILKNDLRKFSEPSNLYITSMIMRGLLDRAEGSTSSRSIVRFTAGMLIHYIDSIQEEFTSSDDEKTLVIVIAIESITVLMEIHLKFISEPPLRVVVLKDLLCPILKWASSDSRAISEAALSALTQISQLYGYDSTKSLIEANIDYVVNGVMQMLENFSHNADVTHVLAITFKLSSRDSFYYFKDVFEKLFRVLAIYQHTEKAQWILLLFYRTLSTLIDWRKLPKYTAIGNPLEDKTIVKKVLHELSIDRRVQELTEKQEEAKKYREQTSGKRGLDESKEEESKLIEAIKSGKLPEYLEEKDKSAKEDDVQCEVNEKKSDDIVLAEKILNHCISMISSDYPEIKILALKTAALGFNILSDEENILLPLVHKLWSPIEKRLVGDYGQNLEVSLSAFECLISMAETAKDFIKRRTLDSIIPRICLFLETQARASSEKEDYGPYSMTVAYKCQLKILTHLGALAYHIELAYSNLWRVVRTTLLYLKADQMKSLCNAAKTSLNYLIALDADCVWYYYSRQQSHMRAEPAFHLVFELEQSQLD